MAERIIETKLILSGKDEYVAGLNEVAAALNAVCDAKKAFDALFTKTPSADTGD